MPRNSSLYHAIGYQPPGTMAPYTKPLRSSSLKTASAACCAGSPRKVPRLPYTERNATPFTRGPSTMKNGDRRSPEEVRMQGNGRQRKRQARHQGQPQLTKDELVSVSQHRREGHVGGG